MHSVQITQLVTSPAAVKESSTTKLVAPSLKIRQSQKIKLWIYAVARRGRERVLERVVKRVFHHGDHKTSQRVQLNDRKFNRINIQLGACGQNK